MGLIAGLAGMLGRFAGRLLNSSLGWATILLFGKVTGRKQTLLLAIALGAIVWVVLLVGVALPDVGAMLLAAVPAPSFVSRDLIRLVMLVAAIVLPLLMGLAALFVMDASQRPKGFGLVVSLLRGYPFALLLAVIIAMLAVVATVRKARALARRWEDAHVAIVVKPGGYDEVLAQLEGVLRDGGIAVRGEPAPRLLSGPPKLLANVAGSGLGSLVPDRLMNLKADGLEALVYPSDISIVGTKARVARARALIAAQLTSAPAYLTTSPESERVEDELRQVADAAGSLPAAVVERRLDRVDAELLRLTVPYDEWETVYRERLQVERAARDGARTSTPASRGRRADEAPPIEVAVAVAAIGATLLDLTLLAWSRLRPRRAAGARGRLRRS